MDFLEKNLEDIIYESNNDALFRRGLNLCTSKKRQVYIGHYGTADIISYEAVRDEEMPCDYRMSNLSCIENCNQSCKKNKIKYIKIQIIELKQNEININAFLQAVRYTKGIKRYLEFRNFYKPIKYEIILIGKTLNKNNSFCYLFDLINDFQPSDILYDIVSTFSFSAYTYKYDFDGITFKKEYFYSLINEGFGKGKNNE